MLLRRLTVASFDLEMYPPKLLYSGYSWAAVGSSDLERVQFDDKGTHRRSEISITSEGKGKSAGGVVLCKKKINKGQNGGTRPGLHLTKFNLVVPAVGATWWSARCNLVVWPNHRIFHGVRTENRQRCYGKGALETAFSCSHHTFNGSI